MPRATSWSSSGWSFWAGWAMVLCFVVAYLLAWHWQRKDKLVGRVDFSALPHWTDRDRQAWQLVEARARDGIPVVAVSPDVTSLKPGDQVFGISKGSFAEYAPARQDKLVAKPANLSFEHAAAVAVSGLTALQGLRDAGHLQQGQHVLIIGASGTGTAARPRTKRSGRSPRRRRSRS